MEAKVKVKDNTYILIRHGDYIEISYNNTKKPEEQDELQQIIFSINNDDVLHNLLGCFYVDQEKGWTLLNRGCGYRK